MSADEDEQDGFFLSADDAAVGRPADERRPSESGRVRRPSESGRAQRPSESGRVRRPSESGRVRRPSDSERVRRTVESHESGVIRLDRGSTRRNSRPSTDAKWRAHVQNQEVAGRRRLRRSNLPALNGPELRTLLREFFADEAESVEKSLPLPLLSPEGISLMRRLLDCLYDIVDGVPGRMRQVLGDQGEEAVRVSQVLKRAFAAELGTPAEIRQYRLALGRRAATGQAPRSEAEAEARRKAEARRRQAEAEAHRRRKIEAQARQRQAEEDAERKRREALEAFKRGLAEDFAGFGEDEDEQ